jgi:hypothetical protein
VTVVDEGAEAAEVLVTLDDDACGDGSAACCELQPAARTTNADETMLTNFIACPSSSR